MLFFIWSAYYNLAYLFEDECFNRLIINHKESFTAAVEVAAVFNSKEFIAYAAKTVGVNILFIPLLIAVAHHNQDLLEYIISLIESFGITLRKMLNKIKYESILCVNSLTTEDNILLFYSIRLENNAALSYLLQKGLNSNGYGDARFEDTLLHLAVRMENEQTQVLLLEHGANPNQGDFKKRTPLHEACESKQWELAILMVEKYHGEMRQPDSDGITPFDLIKNKEIKQKLIALEIRVKDDAIKSRKNSSFKYSSLFFAQDQSDEKKQKNSAGGVALLSSRSGFFKIII